MARTKNIRGVAGGCVFKETNVRPDTWNIKDNCCGDCTTRAIVYALEGTMTYAEVEAEQYRIAREKHAVRNRTGVYDRILVERGWRWIQLSKCMTRGEVAVRLKHYMPGVCALTLSRTHIAAVKNGELLDTWDSRAGRVFAILIPYEYLHYAIQAMEGYDPCKVGMNGVPKLVRSCHRMRRYRNSFSPYFRFA